MLHSVPSSASLVDDLIETVGRRHVITDPAATLGYSTGYRFGGGTVAAVVLPGSLLEQWRVFKLVVAAGRIVIVQAANTGLTGGSTPEGVYDRDVVIISTKRVKGIFPIRGGEQVVCLPGATLYELEKVVAKFGREPHSVIGSSCVGASVVGGICNNSGGALVRRGPAYTQYALFARVDEGGAVRLLNHLGIELGDDVEAMLARLGRGDIAETDVVDDGRQASARDYDRHVRDINAASPARFNADASYLFEASGSAGRVMVLAVRVDTFPKEAQTQTFYIGTNDADALGRLRRHILTHFSSLPVTGEYIHADAFDLADRYGKDMFLAIQWLGTDRLPTLFNAKRIIDRWAARFGFGDSLSDHILQWLSKLVPPHLPERMRKFRSRFAHHLILKMAGPGIAEAQEILQDATTCGGLDWFACTADEEAKAFRHRFAVAGAAVRYRAVHKAQVEDIIALDIALPRNAAAWMEELPAEISSDIHHALYYGHFFCHVFHQDYIVRKGADPLALEHRMWSLLDARGAEYPAEHNVGHLYRAKPTLVAHYEELDPTNLMNPGIGKTSRAAMWR